MVHLQAAEWRFSGFATLVNHPKIDIEKIVPALQMEYINQ